MRHGAGGRFWLWTLIGLAALPRLQGDEESGKGAARKPNLVIIVADDLGYADLGCQGGKEIPTPHIDSLARNGIRFTSGYVSCPVCSPTRAGLLTGRYQQRFGHEFNPGQAALAGVEFGLPLSEITLADRLKAAGYRTGMVGKWHLGMRPKFHPLKRGFEEYFGFLHGAHSYVDAKADPHNPIYRGTEPVDEKDYLTEAFTREATAFIERHRKEPFFLYLTYNAVHVPLHAAPRHLERFPSISDPKRRAYAAMLAALDDGVGAVLKKIRDLELEESTLIFFLSDNGGPTGANTSRNDPFSGYKAGTREGGIRVPFLAQWKGRLPAGKVYEQPVSSLDLFPTALAAAGAQPPSDRPIDGVNLLTYLTGEKSEPPHDLLFWRLGTHAAVRRGSWKLLREGSNPLQLFDLAADAGEQKNLIAEKPDLAEELKKAFERWSAQMAQPLWRPAGR